MTKIIFNILYSILYMLITLTCLFCAFSKLFNSQRVIVLNFFSALSAKGGVILFFVQLIFHNDVARQVARTIAQCNIPCNG